MRAGPFRPGPATGWLKPPRECADRCSVSQADGRGHRAPLAARQRAAARRGRPDRGDVVLGWLTRLTVTLAVLGVVGFDLLSIGVGRLQVQDRAANAAAAARSAWQDNRNVQLAYNAALASLVADGAAQDVIDPAQFSVTPDGTVTLTVTHRATTLLAGRIGPARRWTVATSTATATPVR